ncbi:MAG: TldD/PmbA family protein [Candidatus Eremiobacteraeota bacterium]|nr:TldD/PmbA family protein [Candidatus Eremiobacteraeota bacterium]
MLGQEKAFKIMEEALKHSRADQTELVIMGHEHFLTRYANSQIHQNMAEENATLFIKSIVGKKIGVSTINNFHPRKVARAVENTYEAALKQEEVKDFNGLPGRIEIPAVSTFVPRTLEINPEEKALIVQDMIARTHGDRMTLSGAFYTGASETAVMNSNGVRAYHICTKANITTLTASKDTSGYAAGSSRDVDKLDYIRLVEEALESAGAYNEITTLPPGEYPVILEEYAVADLLLYLAFMGMTADSVEDGHSFITPHAGKKIFKKDISIYDDGLNPDTFMIPFDYEGVPKRRTEFIKEGIVTGEYTQNTYTAGREGKESTGHALPPGAGLSATLPSNLFMEAGNKTNEEMMKQMGTGILIKRFHYLTEVHPLKTIVSGMTRDGVFRVENGEITARVTNMRFTQSIIEAFKHIKSISSNRKLIWFREYTLDFPITLVIPRLYIDKFNFTGQTEF